MDWHCWDWDGCMAIKIISMIERVKSPFNINTMTQISGIIALKDIQQYKLSRNFNVFWLIKLMFSLRRMGFVVDKSYANFILIRFVNRLPIWLIENYIAVCGLSVRSMSEYKLFNSIRVSIGLFNANMMLINLLKTMKTQRFVLVTYKTEESLKQFWRPIE